MKKEYTPAPWKTFISQYVTEVQDGNGLAVAAWTGFDDSRRTKKTHEANARLIAAAPELLEVCEAVLSALNSHQAYDKDMRPELRAVIAKAIGTK